MKSKKIACFVCGFLAEIALICICIFLVVKGIIGVLPFVIVLSVIPVILYLMPMRDIAGMDTTSREYISILVNHTKSKLLVPLVLACVTLVLLIVVIVPKYIRDDYFYAVKDYCGDSVLIGIDIFDNDMAEYYLETAVVIKLADNLKNILVDQNTTLERLPESSDTPFIDLADMCKTLNAEIDKVNTVITDIGVTEDNIDIIESSISMMSTDISRLKETNLAYYNIVMLVNLLVYIVFIVSIRNILKYIQVSRYISKRGNRVEEV